MLRFLFKSLVLALLIFPACSAQSQEQNDGRPVVADWPRFGYGRIPGYFNHKFGQVDMMGLVASQVSDYQWFPDLVILKVTRNQASAMAAHFEERQALLRENYMKLALAEEAGDSVAANEARKQGAILGRVLSETSRDAFHEFPVSTLDQEQLDTVKSLCINVAMNHVSLETLVRDRIEQLQANGIGPDEQRAIRQAIIEVEMELQRELVELRRKAWDKVMAKLPLQVVKQIEADLGFGGLYKNQPGD